MTRKQVAPSSAGDSMACEMRPPNRALRRGPSRSAGCCTAPKRFGPPPPRATRDLTTSQTHRELRSRGRDDGAHREVGDGKEGVVPRVPCVRTLARGCPAYL